MTRKRHFANWLFCCVAVALTSGVIHAQSNPPAAPVTELRLHIGLPLKEKHGPVPAVAWLEPTAGTPALAFVPHGHYTLLQKNRMFIPHLQIIPVGTSVQFPNADPFFHNVFSLFDGKRFDLGLYEAGSSKSVTFTREGASYIFCNIHPEMSAVVLALSTPLYTVADTNDSVIIRNVPPGDYNLHLWIEGIPQPVLDSSTRPVHLSRGTVDLGTVTITTAPAANAAHTNKFGSAYDPNAKSPYEH
ncbi:hypothetical protein [Acidicapsa ligni]|uniref:hypothetical protein n=1 Tax=Acidicapsa ligni TaxID=542300 RepID=UPI0021E0D285|nr:hypothetical protein [Acidicapsa ligni]